MEIEEGNLPVIFLASEAGYKSKLLNALNGLQYGTGGSLFSGKIGEKIFSERFSLFQSRSIHRHKAVSYTLPL